MRIVKADKTRRNMFNAVAVAVNAFEHPVNLMRLKTDPVPARE